MKYASGAIQALQRQARRQGLVWIAIDTAGPRAPGRLDPAAALLRLKALRAEVSAFAFDEAGAVARAYGAKVTPSFYLISAQGRLLYQGGLDPDPETDDAVGPNYLRSALDDLAQGRGVQIPETRPYGCAVEYD